MVSYLVLNTENIIVMRLTCLTQAKAEALRIDGRVDGLWSFDFSRRIVYISPGYPWKRPVLIGELK